MTAINSKMDLTLSLNSLNMNSKVAYYSFLSTLKITPKMTGDGLSFAVGSSLTNLDLLTSSSITVKNGNTVTLSHTPSPIPKLKLAEWQIECQLGLEVEISVEIVPNSYLAANKETLDNAIFSEDIFTTRNFLAVALSSAILVCVVKVPGCALIAGAGASIYRAAY